MLDLIRPGVAAVVALALACGSALAQVPEPEPVTIAIIDVDDTAFPRVSVIVTVVDSDGRPVENLSSGSFMVEETGVSATVTGLADVLDEEIGVGIILTIDTSGSMSGAITQTKAAAAAFVEDLRLSDQTAVVSFSDDVTVEAVLSPDHDLALAALEGLSALGNTALYGAVDESIALAQKIPVPRKAIILLSDGIDFGGRSETTREQSLARASAAGVPIYAIGLGLDVDVEYLQTRQVRPAGRF